MYLQEISGQRQLDFVKKFNYIREAGTEGEKRAASEIREELKQIGVKSQIEEFEFDSWRIEKAEFTVLEPYHKNYQVAGYGFCKNTEADGLEAPFFYAEGCDSISLSFAKGKIVMVNQPLNKELYHKVITAGAVGVLTITGTPADEGEDCLVYTRKAPKNEGISIPGAIIHHKDAMELLECGAVRGRLILNATETKSVSRNVIARIEGTEFPENILTLTAHYDSVPQGPGAYDNMSGCAIIMELCRYFSKYPPKRTMEFIWFGAEEKGLLGSRNYVKLHEKELEKHQFNMNVDLAGQSIGGTVIGVAGELEICHMLEYMAHEIGIGMVTRNCIWASDSNTFAWKGIPAMTLNRDGYGLHTRHDIIDYISAWSLRRSAILLGYIAEQLGNIEIMPFAQTVPEQFIKELNEYFDR